MRPVCVRFLCQLIFHITINMLRELLPIIHISVNFPGGRSSPHRVEREAFSAANHDVVPP
jgi:hypothetical protein